MIVSYSIMETHEESILGRLEQMQMSFCRKKRTNFTADKLQSVNEIAVF
jgi:hypothetical protein